MWKIVQTHGITWALNLSWHIYVHQSSSLTAKSFHKTNRQCPKSTFVALNRSQWVYVRCKWGLNFFHLDQIAREGFFSTSRSIKASSRSLSSAISSASSRSLSSATSSASLSSSSWACCPSPLFLTLSMPASAWVTYEKYSHWLPINKKRKQIGNTNKRIEFSFEARQIIRCLTSRALQKGDHVVHPLLVQ